VVENIFLGTPIFKKTILGRFFDFKKMRSETRKILESIGIDIDPDAVVGDLSVAKKQIVEICKALQRNVRLLILDEPTATLTEREIAIIFDLIRGLRKRGITVIYISHRLDEIFEIADMVTVLRDGRSVITGQAGEFDRMSLITHMVGREIADIYPQKDRVAGKIVLEARNINSKSKNLRDISFYLKKGEVLGITGLVGAGRTELVRAIFGADKFDNGEIFVNGRKEDIRNVMKAIDLKIGLVPEERKVGGLIHDFSVAKNITLVGLKKTIRKTFLNNALEKEAADRYKKMLRISTPSLNMSIEALSGGNQQKCIISKWLYVDADIMIFDEPTRGIDVGAKQEIYRILDNLARQGTAIIIVSSELPEILGMCDRILVMCDGRITAELNGDETSQEEILGYAIL